MYLYIVADVVEGESMFTAILAEDLSSSSLGIASSLIEARVGLGDLRGRGGRPTKPNHQGADGHLPISIGGPHTT